MSGGINSGGAAPRVTIGLTCFNAERTIERAVRSALAQNWPNLEIIVIDDASTDSSYQIVQQLAADNSRIRAMRHDRNGGAAVSRNTILENATGEFIAFFDDDDESKPERIETQVAAIQCYELAKNARLLACFASGERLYSNGYRLRLRAIGSQPEIPKGNEVAEFLLFGARNLGVFYGAGTPTCAIMARASTFRDVGGFDPKLRRAEDIDFAIRLALAGGHFIGCPENLFLQHSTITSDKAPEKNLEAELALIDKFEQFLAARNQYHFARAWFKIRYYHFSGQKLKLCWAGVRFVARFGKRGLRQILSAAPRRIAHERKMLSNSDVAA